MPARTAVDGGALEEGVIHVAPPDRHLVIRKGTTALAGGPRENGHRPSVDRLFSSAAEAYGPHVIGVILTGTLDDGSAGLAVIKSRGGIAVVQDPDDALYRGMPANALERVGPQHVVALDGMAELLADLVRQPPRAPRAMSDSEPIADEAQAEVAVGQ
jgi:two-component system chemotaxis response regulator CheB